MKRIGLFLVLAVVLGAVFAREDASAYPVVEPGTPAQVKDSSNYYQWGDLHYRIAATTVGVAVSNMTPGLYKVETSADVFCDQGAPGVTAALTERIVKAGSIQVLEITGNADTAVACITASSTATVYFDQDKN